jgi:hypothetical protein
MIAPESAVALSQPAVYFGAPFRKGAPDVLLRCRAGDTVARRQAPS